MHQNSQNPLRVITDALLKHVSRFRMLTEQAGAGSTSLPVRICAIGGRRPKAQSDVLFIVSAIASRWGMLDG